MFRLVVLVAGLLCLGAFGSLAAANATKVDGQILTTPVKLHDFTMETARGKSFDLASLKGHWSLLFFGYTRCKKVCPKTMPQLARMRQILKQQLPLSQQPVVAFVSIDAERDSTSQVKTFVDSYDPGIVGVYGSHQQLLGLSKQLHVWFHRVYHPAGAALRYSIKHSPEVMVVNPQGEWVATLSYPHLAKQMASDYRTITKL